MPVVSQDVTTTGSDVTIYELGDNEVIDVKRVIIYNTSGADAHVQLKLENQTIRFYVSNNDHINERLDIEDVGTNIVVNTDQAVTVTVIYTRKSF